MEAIRKIVTVKNHQINITLPEDFYAEEVEAYYFAKAGMILKFRNGK